MVSTASIPRPRRGFEMEEIDGEIVIYRAASNKAIYLNETASVIWQLCDGQRTVGEIVDAIAAAYPDQPSVAGDVIEAIEMLRREGAVQLEPAGAAAS